jgi:hypothetical protein
VLKLLYVILCFNLHMKGLVYQVIGDIALKEVISFQLKNKQLKLNRIKKRITHYKLLNVSTFIFAF